MEGSQNTTFPAKTSVCLGKLSLSPRGEREAFNCSSSCAVPDGLCPVSKSPLHPVVAVEVLHACTLCNPQMPQDATVELGSVQQP